MPLTTIAGSGPTFVKRASAPACHFWLTGVVNPISAWVAIAVTSIACWRTCSSVSDWSRVEIEVVGCPKIALVVVSRGALRRS